MCVCVYANALFPRLPLGVCVYAYTLFPGMDPYAQTLIFKGDPPEITRGGRRDAREAGIAGGAGNAARGDRRSHDRPEPPELTERNANQAGENTSFTDSGAIAGNTRTKYNRRRYRRK